MAEALMPTGVGVLTGAHPVLLGWLLVALACGLDRLVGDPPWCPHPVVVMGWWISRLRQLVERWAGDQPWRLRLGGALITLLLVGGSMAAGWSLEQLALEGLEAGGWRSGGGLVLLTVALASALAGRSLEQAVQAVLGLLPEAGEPLDPARQRLAWIVGRDTEELDRAGILRALAETASENGVDGLFAPLFWMLVGVLLWGLAGGAQQAGALTLPGPLALAWGFKAASTLDSMLGYRRGRLRWLGTAGARLDDLLVWLPCRLTAASLALVTTQPWRAAAVLRAALRDGRSDPSPNAGVSQAAYAWLLGVQLGGPNSYGGEWRCKPLLGAAFPPPDSDSVEKMLTLNKRLTMLWTGLVIATEAAIDTI
jgi:adenosylcobinamide-phosphate synthase